MNGIRLTWTNAHAVAADLVAELADRLQERERFDVADRPSDLDDHQVARSSAAAWLADRSLISSVMCGITCTVLPR